MITPTHQLNHWPSYDVCAWRFDGSSGVPSWVASTFEVSGNQLRHPKGELVNRGDWIVTDGETCFVLTDSEFWKCFIVIPAHA